MNLLKKIVTKPELLELPLLTENVIQMIEAKTASETEAFVRREMISFLSSYQLNRLRHTPQAQQSLALFDTLNFFSNRLLTDFDWQVQLACLSHIANVSRLVTSDLDVYTRRPLLRGDDTSDPVCPNVRSAFSQQIETANLLDVVFVHSSCLSALLKIVQPDSYYDRCVVGAAAELLLGLKSNEVLMAVLPNPQLKSMQIEQLDQIVDEAKLSADLYTRQPVSILDDLISSYQFDLDDDKAVDCY